MKQSMCHLSKILLWIFPVILLSQPAENPQTYCNPMNLNYRFMADAEDAREAADAVIVLFQDNYYLFASRSGGYWTSPDLRNWELIIPTGLDVENYAPGVVVMRDSLFYTPSATGQVYKSGDPGSGVWVKGPSLASYGDPAFFLDDDSRLYMYFGLSNNAPIRVVELDPVTFQEIGPVVDIFSSRADIHGWERRGDDNLLDEQPWIEGAWMIKENGTYYLHYAGPGTEFKTYGDGIYTASSPKGPFTYADYSPFVFKPTGFISGAGHGATFKDKHGQYWHIGTMTISVQHMFERRLDLFPVSFDTDGHIYCNTAFGDYPQYFPGIMEDHIGDHFAGMMLLSHKKFVTASSSISDHGVSLAVDEDARTYWSAQTGMDNEWLIVDLGTDCSVEAVQVNFAEHNTVPKLVRGRDVTIYQQYILETSTDGLNWEMLIDKSQNSQDVPHDYVELAHPVTARYVKLSNKFVPGSGTFAIRDLRVFGNTDQKVISQVSGLTIDRDEADGRDALIQWTPVENADGYIVYYGIAPDKLYNNYMVYDTDSVALHSLNHGVPYFFEVYSFDSGTDYYRPAGMFRSEQSGNWNSPGSWAQHDGSQWIHPAPAVPNYKAGVISILSGDTITMVASDSVDQLLVEDGGVLIVASGASLHIKNGLGTDLMAEGTIINRGSIRLDAEASLDFSAAGTYIHEQDGGTLPAATWRKGSTCVINSVVNDAPANGIQNFYNIVWDCPLQSGNKSMKWNRNTIAGDISIVSTGSGRWQMCAPASGEVAIVFITGNIIQTGGQFSSHGTSNVNTQIMVHQMGNVQVTGGNFSVSRGSQGGTGITLWFFSGEEFNLKNATTQNSHPQGAWFVFTRHGMQTLTLDNVTYGTGGFPCEISSGSILDLGQSVVEGSGDFKLNKGAVLMTAHMQGLDACVANTGARIIETGAGFGFSGSTGQVTGLSIPDTVSILMINCSGELTLSKPVLIIGNVDVMQGGVAAGVHTIRYAAGSQLIYSGAGDQTTDDAVFPETEGPDTLVISNGGEVALHAARTVKNLMLHSPLHVGEYILTCDQVTQESMDIFVITEDGGGIRMNVSESAVLFPVGTTGYAPVWVTCDGAARLITAGVINDRTSAPYGGRIRVLWTLTGDEADGGMYTLQFGWLDRLVNANFRNDPETCTRIYHMPEAVQAGSGDYTKQLDALPRTVARSGIDRLGAFAVGLFSDPTSVEDEPGRIPVTFRLSQNYPNPFNPSTTIEFSIPETARTKVAIFDILGQEIEILADKSFSAGHHQIRWDARDNNSGIYICKIMTKNQTLARKMMLIR